MYDLGVEERKAGRLPFQVSVHIPKAMVFG